MTTKEKWAGGNFDEKSWLKHYLVWSKAKFRKIQTMKRNQSFIEKDGIKPIAYAHLLDEKADPFQSDKPR